MRKPNVPNVYNLTTSKIEKLTVKDRTLIAEPIFTRNETMRAWNVVKSTKGTDGYTVVVSIYDEDVNTIDSKIKCHIYNASDVGCYSFSSFYNPKTMKNKAQLEAQETLLNIINTIIERGIVSE